MQFLEGEIYHVYNRGNNKNPIFFKNSNYDFFINKVRNSWLKFCDIYSYCLMPNHFHFMLQPNSIGCTNITLNEKSTHLQKLSKIIGTTLSSYTQAINVQNGTIGSLFSKKTKSKCISDPTLIKNNFSITDYLINCFNYIHANPLEAKLVTSLKDWPYSSYLDYYYSRENSFCNKSLAFERIGLSRLDFDLKEIKPIDTKILQSIW